MFFHPEGRIFGEAKVTSVPQYTAKKTPGEGFPTILELVVNISFGSFEADFLQARLR